MRITRMLLAGVGFLVLLGSQWLAGDTSKSSPVRFDISATQLLSFAKSFGTVEASNDTLGELLQAGLWGTSPSLRNLTAFEENRLFVYSLVDLSEAKSEHNPGLTRLTRRLVFLKPSTLVVDDEVEASASTSGVEWLLHSRKQPSSSGRFLSLIQGDDELRGETLLPHTMTRKVIRESDDAEQPADFVLQVAPKRSSSKIRFLHVFHVRRREDKSSIADAVLVDQGDELQLTVQVSDRTYSLTLPPAGSGAGDIEVSASGGRYLLARRFFPAGVLPHGLEGVRLLQLWDGSYRGGKRPFWDAGQPSGELRRVIEQGIIRPGRAVDLGCGTGTDAIYLASKGFDVTAVDIAPTALSTAREKARLAKVKVRWLLANVLALPRLGPFDFIFDRGCYHEVRFDNAAAYVEMARRLSRPGRTRFLLLAGNPNEAPVRYAPPQVAEEDIRADFSPLFDFEWLKEARFETSNPAARGPLAWSVMMRRKNSN